MASYLDVLNDARAEIGRSAITVTGITDTTKADTLIGIRAINKVLAKIYKKGVDNDFLERKAIATLSSGNNQISVPTGSDEWDPNIINSVWYTDASQRYKMILLSGKAEADNLQFNLELNGTSNNLPKWWYVFDQEIFVLPVPTAIYTLNLYYSALLSTVLPSQMTSTISMPPDFIETMKLGVEAYLRKADRDPEWKQLETDFLFDLSLSMKRNKFNRKDNGLQIYKLRRSANARL